MPENNIPTVYKRNYEPDQQGTQETQHQDQLQYTTEAQKRHHITKTTHPQQKP